MTSGRDFASHRTEDDTDTLAGKAGSNRFDISGGAKRAVLVRHPTATGPSLIDTFVVGILGNRSDRTGRVLVALCEFAKVLREQLLGGREFGGSCR